MAQIARYHARTFVHDIDGMAWGLCSLHAVSVLFRLHQMEIALCHQSCYQLIIHQNSNQSTLEDNLGIL